MLVVGGKFFYVRAQVIQLCVVMYEIIAFDTAHHMLIIFNIFVLQWNNLKLMFFLKSKIIQSMCILSAHLWLCTAC